MDEIVWPSVAVNEHRLRLRPWLENMLDSGCIRGLEWLDETKSFFKIPWKHRSKKDWDMEHIKVFMEWAKHTGKFQEGDKPDYVAMKTRLRCAFNKAPDIEEVHNLHRMKTHEPYKVYRFIHKPDMESYNQDLTRATPSSSRVCAVQPTQVHKPDEDTDSDHMDSDMDDERSTEHSEIADTEIPTSPTKPQLSPNRKPRRRRKDNNHELHIPITGNDNPSTLAAAEMLLSLTNGQQSVSEDRADQPGQTTIMVTATSSCATATASVSSVATGLIPSLLLAPHRLPSSGGILQMNGAPIRASTIGQMSAPLYPMSSSMASQFMIRMPNMNMNMNELIGQPKIWPMTKSLPQMTGVKAHDMQLPFRNKLESQNIDMSGQLVGQPKLAMMKPGVQMIDGKLHLVYLSMDGSTHTSTTPGKVALPGGAPGHYSSMPYQLMNLPNQPYPISGIIQNKSSVNTNMMKSLPTGHVAPIHMATSVAMVTNGGGHVEVMEIQSQQTARQPTKHEADYMKYQYVNKDIPKDKVTSKVPQPTAGVTYSTQGNIMATGVSVVDKIKQAIARKGHGLVEETLRMRAAYGVTVDPDAGKHQKKSDEKTPPKLVPICPRTIALYQRSRKGVVGDVRRVLERGGDILDLRVSPDNANGDYDAGILDLSTKNESGRFRSAPACLTEDGALDLTLKRKSGPEQNRPNKRLAVKKGTSLAVHAIWDLSQQQAIKHEEAETPEKSPNVAVDLRHSPDGSTGVDDQLSSRSPASSSLSSDDELSDHNYFSMIPVKAADASQGIVVLETDTIAKAHALNGKPGSKQSKPAAATVKTESSSAVDVQMEDEEEETMEESQEEEEMEEEENDTTLAAKQLMQLAQGTNKKSKSLPIEEIIKTAVKKSPKKLGDSKIETLSGNNWGKDIFKKNTPQPSAMSQKDGSRQRLRPWLESKISSGDIYGLEWIHKEQGLFKIPWKHGGKHDWTPENSRIFMEWARHTGRYRVGIDDEDYATWKTRLRCAFNKAPDIVEEKDQSNLNCAEPYRVYRLIPKSEIQRFLTPSSNFSEDEEQGPTLSGLPPLPVVVQECAQDGAVHYPGNTPVDLKSLPSLDLFRPPAPASTVSQTRTSNSPWDFVPQVVEVEEPNFATDPRTGEPYCTIPEATSFQTPLPTPSVTPILQTHTDDLPISSTYTPLTTYNRDNPITTSTQQPYSVQSGTTVTQQPYSVQSGTTVTQQPYSVQSELHTIGTIYMASEQPTLVSTPAPDTVATVITQDMLNTVLDGTSPMDHTSSYVADMNARLNGDKDLRIQLKYQNQVHSEKVVSGQRGCLIASQGSTTISEDVEELLYTARVEPMSHQDQQIASLLQYMKQGVLFTSQGGDIYANRHCQCGVYFTSATGTLGKPTKLRRNDNQVIFNMQRDFLPALRCYREEGGPRPDPEVHLVFGQICDLDGLNDSILITATVTSLPALRLLDQHTEEAMDAEDLPAASPEFHISAPSQPDDIQQLNMAMCPVITQAVSTVESGSTANMISTVTVSNTPTISLPELTL